MTLVLYNPSSIPSDPPPTKEVIPGHKVPYKGLSNQGATCYMNSLLQSFFMIPEFRLMIYNWLFDETKHGLKLYSIPYQLQRLFTQLQIGSRSFVKTKDLSSSFDWDVAELTIQQDIQEFFTVLLDAIEQSDIEKQINVREIFGGLVVDSIKCKVCGNGSRREELFLNISLPINDPFTQTCNSSLEMALENYLKPEILADSNSYACETCNKRVEARKGLSFERLPLMLTFQLNRFTLDTFSMQRVKIKDRITFPFVLNMNNYMHGYEGIKTKSEAYAKELEEELKILERPIEKPKEEPKEGKKEHAGEEIKVKEAIDNITDSATEYKIKYQNEKIDIGKVADTLGIRPKTYSTTEPTFEYDKELINTIHQSLIEQYLKEGPDVYELFSVTVHMGEAFHGHYYVYIKSFEDNYWYCFDDSMVSLATEHDIVKTYGDSSTIKCAYMLIYRRVGTEYPKVGIESVPKYLIEEIEKEKVEEEKKEKVRQEELRKVTLTVYYNNTFYLFRMERDDTLKKLKEKVIEYFEIKTTLDNCMLRAFTKDKSLLMESYSPDKDECTLDKLNITNYREYVFEVKDPEGQFREYTDEDINIKMIIYHPSYNVLEEACLSSKLIPIKKSAKIRELVNMIAEEVKVQPIHEKLRVFRRKETTQGSCFESIFYVEAMENGLKEMNINDGTCLYVETIETEEDAKASRWIRVLEEGKAKIIIFFNNPYEAEEECNNKIITSKNITVGELKLMISERLSIKQNEFVLHRISSTGPELKDLGLTLSEVGLKHTASIFLKFGNPIAIDECRLSVSEAILLPEERNDMKVYEYKYWKDIAVLSSIMIWELKERIVEELKVDKKIEVPITRIRLREKKSEDEGRVLVDGFELSAYETYEGKPITYQILEFDEILDVDKFVIAIKEWNPEDWTLSKGTELVINSRYKLHDLACELCEHFPYYRSRIDQLSIARIAHPSDFKRSELATIHVLLINKVVGNIV